MELLDHMVDLSLSFLRNLHSVFQGAVPVYLPTNSAQGFPFSTSLPTLVISCPFDDGHSEWCEVVCQCGFHLHFPDGS